MSCNDLLSCKSVHHWHTKSGLLLLLPLSSECPPHTIFFPLLSVEAAPDLGMYRRQWMLLEQHRANSLPELPIQAYELRLWLNSSRVVPRVPVNGVLCPGIRLA